MTPRRKDKAKARAATRAARTIKAEGREEIKDIANSGFIAKPINTRTFAKEISQFIK